VAQSASDASYIININLPILTTGLLISIFTAQTPEEQDTLAQRLIAKVYPSFGADEAYHLLNVGGRAGWACGPTESRAGVERVRVHVR
jgi:hypothetical protein